jgi:hypothetical protein
MLACIFPLCEGHGGRRYEAILHSLEHLAAEVVDIKATLATISTKEDKIMGTVEDGLAEVETAVTAEEAELVVIESDETRELADLTALKAEQGGTLSDADQARFDALTASINADAGKLAADDAAINAADPAPAAPAA